MDSYMEEFKKYHNDIILEYDLILYNDSYLNTLLSNHYTLKLNTDNVVKELVVEKNVHCPENLNNCGLSYYDMEKIGFSKRYIETLSYFSKSKTELQDNFRQLSIYDDQYLPLFEINYLLKKFKIVNPNIIYIPKENKEDIIKKYMKTFSSFDDIYTLPKEGSCFFNIASRVSNYNMDTHFKVFKEIYNTLIKLDKNKHTYIIRILPLNVTKITFQLIDILKSNFEEAYLVKPKFDFSIIFYLVLRNKKTNYDSNLIYKGDTNDISLNNLLDNVYYEFYDYLVKKLNEILRVYYSIEKVKRNNKTGYKLIMMQINSYKKIYLQKKLSEIKDKDAK